MGGHSFSHFMGQKKLPRLAEFNFGISFEMWIDQIVGKATKIILQLRCLHKKLFVITYVKEFKCKFEPIYLSYVWTLSNEIPKHT